MVTGKIELVFMPIQLLQALDTGIMLKNEGIEMNVIVLGHFRNTVVSTNIKIQRAHQLLQITYSEARINVSMLNLHHHCKVTISNIFSRSCIGVNVL